VLIYHLKVKQKSNTLEVLRSNTFRFSEHMHLHADYLVVSTWLDDHQGRSSACMHSLHELHMARYLIIIMVHRPTCFSAFGVVIICCARLQAKLCKSSVREFGLGKQCTRRDIFSHESRGVPGNDYLIGHKFSPVKCIGQLQTPISQKRRVLQQN